MLFTPTGDELPELFAHVERVEAMTHRQAIRPPNKPLSFWIEEFNALPNNRQRWCTRSIKIQPCINFLKANPDSTLMVGLRADEEERTGLYGDFATYRYPLREWGWGLDEVMDYLARRGVRVPKRTDCAVCYAQRIGEWWNLWREHPDRWARGEAWESKTGHTFRSAKRDSWPASMAGMRAEFEKGLVPRTVPLPQLFDQEEETQPCRVCRF